MSQVHAIGSLNLDYVYKVPHFLRPGETLEAAHRAVHWGGKGLNQTVAMLRSGLSVRHCGAVGAFSRRKAPTCRTSRCGRRKRRDTPSFK